jgi:hypothetical protein
MFVYTCFNNQSEFGYTNTQLKSGICKYFRRSESIKFNWCVAELLEFRNCENGASIITNLLNRLKILLMEDLSCLDVGIIQKGIKLLKNFENDRNNVDDIAIFCNIVNNGRRSRATSYLKSFYTFAEKSNLDGIKLNRVLKYKKNGDSLELLVLGEKLLDYIIAENDSMVKIFLEMVKLENTAGIRWRRKDGVYLFWEIMKTYFDKLDIFEFALNMFFRKSMNERNHFGVWICLLYLNRNNQKNRLDVESGDGIFVKNSYKLKLDDYVLEDYHVDRNFTLEEFRLNGAIVINEDMDMFDGEIGKLYKNEYTKIRPAVILKPKTPKNRAVIKKKSSGNDKLEFLEFAEFIDWNEFSDIIILEDGVCGGKVCCLRVVYNGQIYILKEMTKSMNYGLDYLFMDSLKKKVGLLDMNMKLIKSNGGLIKRDKQKGFRGNCELGTRENVYYCLMEYFENIGDIGKHKHLLVVDNEMRLELLLIRLFDGLFRSSDNILRNVLVNSNNELLSIDENDIFGKRSTIFNKNDWCSKKNYNNREINSVCEKLLSKLDKTKIIEMMREFGFIDKIAEFETRYDNYKEIVMAEF